MLEHSSSCISCAPLATPIFHLIVSASLRNTLFFYKKKISIEQAQQHEHNLKEREKQRVAKLEDMMRIVQIGDAIQRGKD
jgi:selenocysteine lyase/cysteine desulfurase